MAHGDTLFNLGQYEEALSCYRKCTEVYTKEGLWKLAYYSLYREARTLIGIPRLKEAEAAITKMETLTRQRKVNDPLASTDLLYLKGIAAMYRTDFEEAHQLLLKSVINRNRLNVRDSILFKAISNLAYIDSETGDFDQAKSLNKQAIQLADSIYGPFDQKKAATIINLASLYLDLGDLDSALIIFDKAEQIFNRNQVRDNPMLPILYMNKAIIYKQKGDYERSLRYYQESEHRMIQKQDLYTNQLVLLYNNIGTFFRDLYKMGITYMGRNNIEEAIGYYKKALELASKKAPGEAPLIHNNLGVAYSKKGDNKEAEIHFREAITLQEQLFGKNHYQLSTYYLRYGEFYADQLHNAGKAVSMFQKALRISLLNYGEVHINTGICYKDLGLALFMEGKVDSALISFQHALIAMSDGFHQKDPIKNPSLGQLKPGLQLLDVLKYKGNVLLQQYQRTKNHRLLSASFNTFQLADNLIDRIRREYSSEDSKVELMSKGSEIYNRLIDEAWLLYSLTGQHQYISKEFEYMERSKGSTLLSSIRNIEAQEFGGIPPALTEYENRLRREISFYQENLYEEQKAKNPNATRISAWEQILFHLNQKYDSLIRNFEHDYPNYYTLKFNTSVIGLNECRAKLKKRNALIEYAITDQYLYALLLTKDSLVLKRLPADSAFYSTLSNLHNEVSSADFSGDQEKHFQQYKYAATYLYSLLVSPFSSSIKNKHLVIIPDGMLAYLPFEILVLPGSANEFSYRKLPYLVKYYPVEYSYSATLLFQTTRQPFKFRNKLLAIAPSYTQNRTSHTSANKNTRQYLDNLFPIPGSREEAIDAEHIFRGKLLMDQDATEGKFKQIAGKYDILHLSMHTIIDDANPMYSKLIFSRSPDSKEDGLLNTYEIYNLRLSCQLAVLSSCNSGKGKLQRGEGVMSLARAFIYAGCPSIVMSLWEVEDKTSVGLMKLFYQLLRNGDDKAVALQQAKLHYLKEADPLMAHPYFWSGFVFIGNETPLTHPWISRVFIILFFGAGIFLIIKLSSRHKKKQDIPSSRK